MKPLALLVHGIRVDDPERSVGRLRGCFERAGFDFALYEYGRVGLVRAAAGNRGYALGLLSAIRICGRPVVVIGHSNGCALIHRAAREQAMDVEAGQGDVALRLCAYLSPALDADAPAAPGIERIVVAHTRHDHVVRWARVIPGAYWGDMGACGATTGEPYENHDYSMTVNGHSDWMSGSGIEAVDEVAIRLAELVQSIRL